MLRAYDWCLKFLYSVRAKQKRNSLFKRKWMQQQQLSCNKCVCFYFYIFIVKSFENIFIFLVSLSLQIQLFHHWENVLMKCFDFWNFNMEFRILISVFVRVYVWALMFFFYRNLHMCMNLYSCFVNVSKIQQPQRTSRTIKLTMVWHSN